MHLLGADSVIALSVWLMGNFIPLSHRDPVRPVSVQNCLMLCFVTVWAGTSSRIWQVALHSVACGAPKSQSSFSLARPTTFITYRGAVCWLDVWNCDSDWVFDQNPSQGLFSGQKGILLRDLNSGRVLLQACKPLLWKNYVHISSSTMRWEYRLIPLFGGAGHRLF